MSTGTCASYDNIEDVRAVVKESLKPLFEKARREDLWFRCRYQELWFSPDELEKAQDRGSFLWGHENWMLDDPREHLADLKRRAEHAERAVREFEKRLTANG